MREILLSVNIVEAMDGTNRIDHRYWGKNGVEIKHQMTAAMGKRPLFVRSFGKQSFLLLNWRFQLFVSVRRCFICSNSYGYVTAFRAVTITRKNLCKIVFFFEALFNRFPFFFRVTHLPSEQTVTAHRYALIRYRAGAALLERNTNIRQVEEDPISSEENEEEMQRFLSPRSTQGFRNGATAANKFNIK